MPTATKTGLPRGASAPDPADHPLFCTFCRKSSSEVAKLLSGHGVYICDGCVASCNAILANEPTAGFDDSTSLSDDELVLRLSSAARATDEAERRLRAMVDELRSRNVTWARIGEALGVSRQAAWERFSGED
ncbi:MAG: hypothetical protein QOE63_1989 [Acidimicrobiaceae bacterium]|jgi:ATP-dependent Clp protease ATP-binding subunit ClpX